jgi:hypothetical protein
VKQDAAAPDDHDEKTRFPADHKDTSSHAARSRVAARLLRRHLTMEPATPPSAMAPKQVNMYCQNSGDIPPMVLSPWACAAAFTAACR